MPIYEFRCPTCGNEEERLQRMSDPNPPCEREGCVRKGAAMEKKVSKSNFELKGGGWSSDGYGS